MIFQLDESDFVSRIRLTTDFKGMLPDATPVDMKNFLLKDVFKVYPDLINKWYSQDCSDYWTITNDTLTFYVKIDKNKNRYPVDEAYYMEKPVEAIDLVVSCYSIFKSMKNEPIKLLNDPIFFLDSVNVSRFDIQKLDPKSVSFINVYKDSHAIKLMGPFGKDGVIYITTKKYAMEKYWQFLSSRSQEYLKVVPSPGSDSDIVYIINNKVFKKDTESNLFSIDAATFIDLKVISQKELHKQFKVKGKKAGIVIRTTN
jgi:hypothetical protein